MWRSPCATVEAPAIMAPCGCVYFHCLVSSSQHMSTPKKSLHPMTKMLYVEFICYSAEILTKLPDSFANCDNITELLGR